MLNRSGIAFILLIRLTTDHILLGFNDVARRTKTVTNLISNKMNSLKLLLKCLAAMSTSLLFLNSAISANAECTTGLWSADWEVK